MACSRNGSVVWIRLTGVEAARLYSARGLPPVDMVFVDADHSYQAVIDDWTAWNPLLAPGGIICFHDSVQTFRSPAVESVRAMNDIVRGSPEFEVVDAVDTLTVLRRRP